MGTWVIALVSLPPLHVCYCELVLAVLFHPALHCYMWQDTRRCLSWEQEPFFWGSLAIRHFLCSGAAGQLMQVLCGTGLTC